MKLLENATIEWPNSQTPFSSSFDDVYFSRDDGIGESQYVFLQNNHLPERFAQLTQQHFCIGETGFGTGLNFLLSCQLFAKSADEGKSLYYISSEKYPLRKKDLRQALNLWPEFSIISEQLIKQYPEAIAGQYLLRFKLNNKEIFLLLLLGDSLEGFNNLLEHPHPIVKTAQTRAIDAWFLDGFTPSKNNSMWQDDFFTTMAKLSKPSTTVATFTAAGFVKRGLKSAGFNVEKRKGYGKKRDMVCAHYIGLPEQHENIKPTLRHKKLPPFWPIQRSENDIKNVIIVGAGIAGCTTAKTLAESNINVLLVDKNSKPMQEASGNPQGVLFPKLSASSSTFSDFNYLSFSYALQYYQQESLSNAFEQCGLIQLLDEKAIEQAQKLHRQFKDRSSFLQLISPTQASEISGTKIEHQCLYYPKAGFIRTQQLASTVASHRNITFKQAFINNITSDGYSWKAISGEQTFSADAIIICNAEASKDLLDEDQLISSQNIRGQISNFPAKDFNKIKTVICHDGYICPAINNTEYSCGATFELKDTNSKVSSVSREKNLSQLSSYLPDFNEKLDDIKGADRVNFRCASKDYMPIVGPIPIAKDFSENYALLAKNRKAFIPIQGSYHNGLFLNIAYGSRGFSSAPICAELIKSYLIRTPFPLPFEQVKALNPARFLINRIGKSNADN